MCRSRLWLLYWVSTAIRRIPALTRLDSAKSTSRYMPPNGTAGLARSAVSGASRLPAPPASTMPRTRLSAISHPSRAICFFQHAIQDLLRFFLDAGQLSGTGERLRVELVDVFCARGAGGEPAILGDHLDAAQRLAVARGPGQPVQHPLAREFADADLVRGELGQQGLLRPGRGRVDPGVRPVTAAISEASRARMMPSLSVVQTWPSVRRNEAPALSSPPKAMEPSSSPGTNHLNPTGTSYNVRPAVSATRSMIEELTMVLPTAASEGQSPRFRYR